MSFFSNSFSKHDQLLQARLYTVLIFTLDCMVSHDVKQVWDIQTVKPLLNWRFKFQSFTFAALLVIYAVQLWNQ